jgi:hypothetical protein
MKLGGVSPYREELEKQSVLPIAELELENAIGADLRHRCHPPRLQVFSKSGDERGGRGGSSPTKLGQMSAESGVDDKLLLVVGLCEFEEQNLGGEVVDVRDAESSQALLKLVRDDLRPRC